MIVLLQLAGCGKGDGLDVVPIYGVVTWQGQPVPNLFLNFEPTKGRPSWAMTDAQGRYEAHDTPSRAGVLAGECRGWVMIKPQTPQEEQQFLNGKHPRLQELKPLLTKYGRLSTPLILAISSDKIEVDLVLD